MDYFKPYSGIYKITQLTDTEKYAKKFFRVAPPPVSGGARTPCTPYKVLILKHLHKQNGRQAYKTQPVYIRTRARALGETFL